MILNGLLAASMLVVPAVSPVTIAVQQKVEKDNYYIPPGTFTLKKPDSWDNIWYNICIVNGLSPSWFWGNDKYNDLMYVKEMYKVTNDDISDKLGTLYKVEDKFLSKDPTKIEKETFTNNSDDNVNWKTKEYSTELKQTQSWHINANIDRTNKINFLFGSDKISINLSGGYESTTEKTTKEIYPSQNLNVKPHSTATLNWTTWTTTHKLKGGVEYDLNWNDKQYTYFSYHGGKDWIQVNVGWTMWALANTGQERFFKRGGDDLFILENDKLFFNVAQEWTIAGQECNHEYNN